MRTVAGLLLVVALVASGCGGGSDEVSAPATTSVVKNAVLTTSTSAPSTTAASPMSSFSDGIWAVGSQVAPGAYMTSGVENCYWSRLDSLADEHGHRLAGGAPTRADAVTEQVIVAILATDVGFSSFDCGTWTSVEPSSLGRVSSLSDGIWAVGSQVAPGTYMTSEVRNCGWSRLSGFSGGFADTIAGKMVDGQGIVEILATDVGFSSFDCGTWTFVTTSTTSQAPATTSTTSTTTQAPTTTSTTTTIPVERTPTPSFGPGTWLVGSEVAPGTWRTTAPDGCNWKRLAGFSGDISDEIAYEWVTGNVIVEISATDAGFQSESSCGTWELVDIAALPAVSSIGPGIWAVGSEVAPGTWRATGTESCPFRRLAGFSGEDFDVIVSSSSLAGGLVEISATDAGFRLHRNCGTWELVAAAPATTTVAVQVVEGPFGVTSDDLDQLSECVGLAIELVALVDRVLFLESTLTESGMDDLDLRGGVYLGAEQVLSGGSPSFLSEGIECEEEFPQVFGGLVSSTANWFAAGTQMGNSDSGSLSGSPFPDDPDLNYFQEYIGLLAESGGEMAEFLPQLEVLLGWMAEQPSCQPSLSCISEPDASSITDDTVATTTTAAAVGGTTTTTVAPTTAEVVQPLAGPFNVTTEDLGQLGACRLVVVDILGEVGMLISNMGEDYDENQALFLDVDQRLGGGPPSILSDGVTCEERFPQLLGGFVSNVANWIAAGTELDNSDFDLTELDNAAMDPDVDPADVDFAVLLPDIFSFLETTVEVADSLDGIEWRLGVLLEWESELP